MSLATLAGLLCAAPLAAAQTQAQKPPRTGADVLAQAPAEHWCDVAPDNLLVMTLPQGRVLIELAERFAPQHVANIRALARNHYWDGLSVLRVQDNYVAQWGDPNDEDATKARPKAGARAKLPAEFSLPLAGLPLTPLRDVDGWAPVAGHVEGFQVAANPQSGRAWLAHCYGVVGAGRGDTVDSSTGAELYAMLTPARGLDLNITVVGRVLQGMHWLAALPRGTGAMGFYASPEQHTTIQHIRLSSSLPEAERPRLQVLRSDSSSWQEWLQTRRQRGGWFVHSPGYVDLCSASAPVREAPPTAQP
ncbi:peptidylprolyl isomerase [Roseateles sp. BYS180W]|uniref:peptidylprolyl isomerase n=1 Tax=Roseateles rivi TaxID=3299028 RepID=UPI0037483D7E